MSLFKYTAIDGRGATKHGMLDEADKGSVAKRLMGMGLRPLEISPHREGKEKKFSFSLASFIKPKMSKADIMGLGPFLKALGERLDRMTKEEICRVLVQHGKTIPAVLRRSWATAERRHQG